MILKDIKYRELKAIIDFMYRGEVYVIENQVLPLLKAAQTLKVKGLGEVDLQYDQFDYAAQNASDDESEDPSSKSFENHPGSETEDHSFCLSDACKKAFRQVQSVIELNDKGDSVQTSMIKEIGEVEQQNGQSAYEFLCESEDIDIERSENDPCDETEDHSFCFSDAQKKAFEQIQPVIEQTDKGDFAEVDLQDGQSGIESQNLFHDESEDPSVKVSENYPDNETINLSFCFSEAQKTTFRQTQSRIEQNDSLQTLMIKELGEVGLQYDQSGYEAQNASNDESEDTSTENHPGNETVNQSLCFSDVQEKASRQMQSVIEHNENANPALETMIMETPKIKQKVCDDMQASIPHSSASTEPLEFSKEKFSPSMLKKILEKGFVLEQSLQDSVSNLNKQTFTTCNVSIHFII